jgi:pimeloyl-ACP methyl ester carboxylesterase
MRFRKPVEKQRMIAPLAKCIDWSVAQTSWLLLWQPVNDRDLKLEQAVEFLTAPDFIPAESKPAELQFTSSIHFKFPSPRPCEFAENNVVPGRLYRCAEAWQKRPVIVLLHGGMEYLHYRFGYARLARRCNRAGFNAVTLESPYHFQRRPRQYGPVSILGLYAVPISSDYVRMAQTYAQAIAEVRSLCGWLLAQGCPAVALAGVSLGAYLGGLTACRDGRLAAVVMALPIARQGNVLVAWGGWIRGRRFQELILRRRTACEELDRTPLNLALARPVIPRENILLIEGMHEVSTFPEEIWQAWGQPDIWRLPHSHITTAFMPGLTGRILRWLAPRLDNPFSPDRRTPPNEQR